MDAVPILPDELLAIAEDPVRKRQHAFTAKERRSVLQYLFEHGWRNPDLPRDTAKRYSSNYALAELFFCDEATIRSDKKALLKGYTKHISANEAMSFVGEYLRSYDRLIRQAEEGLAQCGPGDLAERDYLKLISELLDRRMKLVQGIGVVPKELGRVQVSEEIWVAETSEGGLTSLREGSKDDLATKMADGVGPALAAAFGDEPSEEE